MSYRGIGNYSHNQLVDIICKYIGEALGTDGCIDARDLLTSMQSGMRDLAETTSLSVQRITSKDARIRISPTPHFGALEVARDAVLTIEAGAEMEIM
jgi:hypothetical protein